MTMTEPRGTATTDLAARLDEALASGSAALDELAGAEPVSERDRLLTLARIHDLHTAPLDAVRDTVRWQHHPVVADLKTRLERAEIHRLECRVIASDVFDRTEGDAVAAVRSLARRDLVPPVYTWLAEEASWDEFVEFIAIEGGPDGGFDDLVASCQVGLSGRPKLELARNYWDEMGRGELRDVHTELHRDLAEAVEMPRLARESQPTVALRRSVLGTILATNCLLQAEMVGALGLLELQAGPRCRKVVRALERLDAPAGAFPFYVEHAEVDPHHGKAWLDEAIAPLSQDPRWARSIVRGAAWRSEVNAEFFAAMDARFTTGS